MYTSLIFKEQAKDRRQEIKRKGLTQSHFSIQHNEGYKEMQSLGECTKLSMISSDHFT
jgi:hypothetical protein